MTTIVKNICILLKFKKMYLSIKFEIVLAIRAPTEW